MVIEKILKQLTPERIEREIKTIQNIELPLNLQKWVKEYEKVGGRDPFIWNWAYRVSKIITFPNVPHEYCQNLYDTKFLLIMFIVLLDDVADKMKNKKLLAEILKIPIENKINFRNCPKKKYLQLTKKVWRSLNKKICSFPLYKNFEEIIEYDLKQIINGMDYAYLVNKNFYLINETESTIYLSFNTPGTISYMIDLTCMKNFKMRNLGIVRKIAWYTQVMTRIANWVVTWEREIKEKDFTSGIFAYALENNFINIENLKNNDTEIILKIRESGAENYFLKEWDNLYNKINKLNKKNQDINIKAILKQIKLLTVLHLISRNLI